MGRRTRRLAGRGRGRRTVALQSPVVHAGRALHDGRPAARLLYRRVLRPLLRPVAGIARLAFRFLRRGGGRHPDQRDRGDSPAGSAGIVLAGGPPAGASRFLCASVWPRRWRWPSPPRGSSTSSRSIRDGSGRSTSPSKSSASARARRPRPRRRIRALFYLMRLAVTDPTSAGSGRGCRSGLSLRPAAAHVVRRCCWLPGLP